MGEPVAGGVGVAGPEWQLANTGPRPPMTAQARGRANMASLETHLIKPTTSLSVQLGGHSRFF